MNTWISFFTMTGGLLFLAGLIVAGGWFDDRRDAREREAQDAARRTAAE